MSHPSSSHSTTPPGPPPDHPPYPSTTPQYQQKKPNTLPQFGNPTTMNLNPLIHTNIEGSPYFNGKLQELKTYHELVDEIYYKVKHLEPWERGSRNAGGRRQTGMCGGVRGVGLGGIVSSAFCLLYRLHNLRLTRKQLYGLLNHGDSPYIRGIGFLYVRFTQPPTDFWDWFEPYLDDEEEVDVRAGGGQVMRIGELVRHLITRQDWFSTLFPRIPVPIQIGIDKRLKGRGLGTSVERGEGVGQGGVGGSGGSAGGGFSGGNSGGSAGGGFSGGNNQGKRRREEDNEEDLNVESNGKRRDEDDPVDKDRKGHHHHRRRSRSRSPRSRSRSPRSRSSSSSHHHRKRSKHKKKHKNKDRSRSRSPGQQRDKYENRR